jgi:hypothetical protein
MLVIGPPAFAAPLGGMLVGLARKLTVEPDAPALDFVVLLSIAGVCALPLAIFLVCAARVRRGAHTYFPRLWRAVPWTAAGGFLFGLIAAGVHALTK